METLSRVAAISPLPHPPALIIPLSRQLSRQSPPRVAEYQRREIMHISESNNSLPAVRWNRKEKTIMVLSTSVRLFLVLKVSWVHIGTDGTNISSSLSWHMSQSLLMKTRIRVINIEGCFCVSVFNHRHLLKTWPTVKIRLWNALLMCIINKTFFFVRDRRLFV